MHRTALASAFAAVLAACGTIDDFEEVITDEATLPSNRTAGTPLNPNYGGDFNSLQLSKAKNFESMGVKPGDVDAIFVKSLTLEMDSGSNNPEIDKLSTYVQSMEIWVEAPGQEHKVVARLTSVPATKSADLAVEAEFSPSAADDKGTGLKPYAVAESMQVGAELVLTEQGASPFLNIKLKTTMTLLIDVNILGL